MAKRNVRALRDERAAFPEAANARVKALRQLFKWAIEYEHVQHNPARDVPYLKGKNRDGHHTWTIAEVQQFEERHPLGSKARLALALLLYTGVRRSDVVKLGPQMERDEGDGGKWLHFTITKGNKDHQIPILLSLREVLDVSPSGHLAYLVTEFGKPYTANGFGNWFRRRCDEAGLRHCSAHGLRKGGATIAAENGATEHELMAIYNWDSPKQAAAYTRKANRKRLVSRGMAKLTENESVPLSEVVSYGGTIRGKKPC
jgi:integrase